MRSAAVEPHVSGDISTTEAGSTRLQFLAAFSATFAYLISGTFLGWLSPTLPRLLAPDSPIPLTPDEGSWVAASMSVGMVLAPLPTGYIADLWGRKPTLAFVAAPFLASWLLSAFAKSVELLYVSRIVASIGMGVAFTVGPMYMGEIAEDRIRGSIGTLFQVMLNIGTLFEFCIGPYVPYISLNIASAIFPIIFFITFICMPESPYFLLSKNQTHNAEISLLRLRGKKNSENVKEELEMMQMAVEMQVKEKGSFRDLFGSSGNRKALMLVVGLMFFQNFSGIIPLLAYSTQIFMQSGSSLDASISVIILGVVQLVVSIISSLLVDWAGRRPLLLLSCVGSAVALFVEGLYFFLASNKDTDLSALYWLPVTALVLYLVAYTLGLGPVPWAIAGEMFPSNVKGLAVSLVSMCNALMSFAATKLFQVISDEWGVYVPLWIFAIWCLIGAICITFLLPETKGKSLLQINEELNAG